MQLFTNIMFSIAVLLEGAVAIIKIIKIFTRSIQGKKKNAIHY